MRTQALRTAPSNSSTQHAEFNTLPPFVKKNVEDSGWCQEHPPGGGGLWLLSEGIIGRIAIG